MTPYEIYKRALTFVFERPGNDADFKEFFPEFLNVTLDEALSYENMIRKKQGREELEVAPVVTSETLNTPLDISERICRTALPFGVAHYYFQDDGNDYSAQEYRQRFIVALGEAVGGAYVADIEDVYGYGYAAESE